MNLIHLDVTQKTYLHSDLLNIEVKHLWQLTIKMSKKTKEAYRIHLNLNERREIMELVKRDIMIWVVSSRKEAAL